MQGTKSGAVYSCRYTKTSWTQENINSAVEFGVSVEVGENVILVGARHENENGIYEGYLCFAL